MKDIIIPSLSAYVGSDLASDALNCPVRALRLYLNRTDNYRGDRVNLFLPMHESRQSEIAPGTISSWLKSAISLSYSYAKERQDFAVPIYRGHQVRGLAASWAAKGNVSLQQLMNACFWKSQSTFSSHYLKDVWTDKDGTFTIGPVVAAQKIIPKTA